MLDALWIVLLGMALVFGVLALLHAAMTLLNKLIKPKEKD
jgi:Na+-transporting methylmalonyl-CoA/oxaloacetate decarboxylase gamma subunit